MADARGTARLIRERYVNPIKRQFSAAGIALLIGLGKCADVHWTAEPLSHFLAQSSPIALERGQASRTTRMLTVRGCRPLATPAIGKLHIPRFAVRYPGTVESLVHYMFQDGSPGSDNLLELPCSRPGAVAMGTMVSAGLPRMTAQMDANGSSTKWVGYQS